MNLGDLIAYLKIDDTGFQGKIPAAKQALEAVKGAAKATGQAVATTFTVGTTAASGFLVNLLKTGVGYNSLQQNSRAALKVMLGSTEAVNAQMQQMDDFARNSPFAKQVFIQAQQQMLGFGVAAKDVIPALDAIQNAVAAQGMGAPEIERAVYSLSQMKAQGKLTGKVISELGMLGIDAATIIGEEMGKTGSEIREMASKPGGIPVDQVWDPLVNGLMTKFGGATDNIKQQWTGATDRIKGATRDIGAELARPFVDPNGGGQAVVWANSIADIMRSVETHVKTAMPVVEKALGGTFTKITDGLRKANAAVAGFNMQGLIRQVQTLTKYEPLLAGVGTALFMVGLRPIPVIGQLAGGIMPLVAGIAALVAKTPELDGLGAAFQKGLGEAGHLLPDLIVQVLDLGMSLISALAPGLLAASEASGKLVGAVLQLAPALVSIVNAGVPIVGFAADLVAMFTKLPAPVLAALAAFAALKALNVGAILTKGFGGAQTAIRGLNERMALQTALAKMSGVELTKMGAAAAVARVGISGLGAALKVAFISNAPLLAVTALITVLGYFSQRTAEAKSRADSYAEAVKLVGEEARQAAADVAAFNFAHGENVDWGWFQKMFSGYKDLGSAIEGAGFSVKEFGEIATGSQEDFDGLIQKINDMERAGQLNWATADALRANLYMQRNALDDAAAAQGRLGDSTDDTTAATEAQAAAMKQAADAVDRLRNAEQSLAAAKGDLKMAQYATKDAMDALTASIEENKAAARDANGVVDESSAAFRAFDESMISAERAWRTQIDAMIAARAPQDEINAKVAEARSQLGQQALAFYENEDAANAYMDSLGGIPDYVSTIVELDTNAAEEDIESLFQQVTDSHPVLAIDATTSPAHAKLLRQLGLVEKETGVFALDANDSPATAKMLMTLGRVDTSTGTMTFDANNQPSLDRLGEALATTRNSKESFWMGAKDHSASIREEALRRVRISKATFNIYAKDNATSLASQIVASINRMKATITIGSIASKTAMVASAQADGGIITNGVQTFAHGGFSKLPDQAMIQAPMGRGLIQWAEGETEGEGFVPLAASKRARSLAIMDEIAARFGYVMVKRSDVTSRADGGVSGSSVAQGQPFTTIGAVNLNVDVRDVEELVRASDALDALFLMLRMRGVPVHG